MKPIERLNAQIQRVPAWAWLAGIAIVTRFINLGSENVWYDESFTDWLAKLDISHLWTAIQGDVHPPLWYFIEWLNVRIFGDSTFALRLPSAILSVIAVLLVWRLALAVGFEHRTAFIAGLLAAVLPASVYYGQDARMYPLLCCCVLGAALCAMRGRWWLFALCCIGAVYAQNLGILYTLSIGGAVVVIALLSRHGILKPVLAGIGIVLAWLPWLPSLLHQVQGINRGFWIQPLTLGGALWPLANMTLGWRMPDSIQIHAYGMAIGLSLVGLIASRKWLFTRNGLIVLAVMLGTPILAILASMVWRSVYLSRAMLPASLMMMLVWAYPLNHLSVPNRQAARIIAVPMIALALFFHYFPAADGRFQVDQFVASIKTGWQTGDVIYDVSIDTSILGHYYLAGLPYGLFPYASDLNQSLSPETKVAMGFNQVNLDDLKAQGYRRAWVLTTDTPLTSQTELNEVQRVKDSYPWTLIKQETIQTTTQAILLVNLQ
jgi:uncharacterized membrane protein